MGRDRLLELRRRARDGGEEGTEDGGGDNNVDMGEGELADVLLETQRLHAWVDEIAAGTREARDARALPEFSAHAGLQRRAEEALARAAAAGPPLCAALAALQRRATASTSDGLLARRVAHLHCACVRRRAAAALSDHHALLGELRDHRRALLAAQLRLLERPLSEGECERLLDDDAGGGQLFVGDVAAQSAAARAALRDAEERRDELLAVEAKLKDVRDLFHQLALLLATQQEQVDTVEAAARQAHRDVGGGREQLLRGSVRRRGACRKKLSVALCLTAGCLVVGAVLVLT